MRPEFNLTPGVDGWQLSNPSIFAMAPLRSSLEVFHRAGMARLREKSIRLTAYLADCLQQLVSAQVEVRTPTAPEQRGAQLSLRVHGSRDTGKSLFEFLAEDGIVADWREPDIIRVAPTPLYNRYGDCLRLVQRIQQFQAA